MQFILILKNSRITIDKSKEGDMNKAQLISQ